MFTFLQICKVLQLLEIETEWIHELTYIKYYNHNIHVYQSPLILTELFQHDLINVSYVTACYLYQVMMTLHFLNDVTNDTESTQKSKYTS